MAGAIDFSTLNHFKDGATDYYHITIEGYSILEYLRQAEERWNLYLPLLGMFTSKNAGFDPDDIARFGKYLVKLDRVDGTFCICRYGSTEWL